jgi:hypothetical protein
MSKLKKITPASCLLALVAGGLWPAALPAQTCQTASIPATTPSSQFLNNGDGTVTDNRTGLTWKRCSEGQIRLDCTGGAAVQYTWPDALARAKEVNDSGGFAGHADWRVPNIKELRSLVERQCVLPAINAQVFPGTPVNSFWSSSPYAGSGSGNSAWSVDFFDGGDAALLKSSAFFVRLVRGGQ